MSSNFKIFCVSFEDEYKEYIVAETPEQALDYYNSTNTTIQTLHTPIAPGVRSATI